MNKEEILLAYQLGKLTISEAKQKLHRLKNPTLKRPLSEGQKGLWMLQKTSPDMSAYNVPICFRVDRKLERDKFQQACCFLLEQYPILNTVIGEEQGVPYQIIQPAQPLFFETEDISKLGPHEILPYLRNKLKIPFRLEEGPLMRVHLFTRSNEEQMVLIIIHHIIFDGSSLLVLVTKLLTIYQDLLQDKVPKIDTPLASYHDFVEWEQTLLSSKAGAEHLAYWKQQLSGTLPVWELPTDHPRSSAPSYEGQVHTKLLSPELADQIKACSDLLQINRSVMFLGLFKVLLRRYTNQADLIIGLPTLGRFQERFSSLIGYFINMIPIRSQAEGSRSFAEYVRELQLTLVDGLDHAEYPFPALVRALNVPRIPGRAPVFQVIFLYQNYIPANIPPFIPEDDANQPPFEFIEEIHQEGEYELELEVYEQSDTFKLNFKYDPRLFKEETIVRMVEHYLILTSEVMKDPNTALDSYSFLSEAETRKLLIDWNATKINYPKEKCVHQLFEEQVQKTPEAIAVVFEAETLTYREVDEKSTQLAIYLQKQGVKPNSLVGICVERHWEMIVGLLGILKAGGAYVPLDPEYPEERLKYMLENSKVSVLLTQARLMTKISHLLSDNLKAVALDKDWADIQEQTKTRTLKQKVNSAHLAYVIYTSGSTGKPKGVMIPHRALTNFLVSMSQKPGLSSQDRLLAVTTFCFDIAGLELYLPLINGAQVYICSSEKAKDVEKLKQEIHKCQPTIMQATPVTWTMLFRTGWRNEERIKILCGGEALSETLKQSFMNNQCELWNLFGPTETTIWSTIEFITKEKPITLGRPIANTQIYIIDENLKLTPIGIPGELCIAGDGLARGYLHQPELTQEKFIDNPFEPGTKLYRTGDLARWTLDGTIEFLGRMDHQVKIRGFRIELGEIESQLLAHPEIQDGAVIVKEQGDHQQLVAFYVAQKPLSQKQLRAYLSSKLPEYMIPASFIELDKMPFTPNGKHDRKTLGNLPDAGQRTEPPREKPHFEIEAKVLEIWKEVLHRNDIGLEEGFFDVGGDSFSAVTVAGRIKEDINCDFSVTELFQYANIREISKYIADTKKVVQSPSQESMKSKPIDHQRMIDIKTRYQSSYPDYYQDSIAIIGISCQFPGAKNYLEFWDNLRAGKESVKFFSKEELLSLKLPKKMIENPNFVPIQATIEDKDLFDPGFFNISPHDAEYMDPQFRLLLLHSWKAVEDAGYVAKQIPETSVFMSAGNNLYSAMLSNFNKSFAETHNSEGYVAWLLGQGGTIPTMISHKLGFTGPSLFVHSNCSSSLVGVNLAFQSLRSGEAKYALVGAASISSLSNFGYIYEEGLNFSSDGHVKAFDASADGMIGSEGVAVIVLKKAIDAIENGDNIYAILRGIGINNDGADKVGFYAPSVKGQAAVIQKVLDTTKIHPESISYIEAHGTGTKLGDPIEFAALNETYRQYITKKEYCGIGSVKTNIGHLDTAAGLAGCIKVALSLYHGEIPPSLNYKDPNPNIDIMNSPFYVVDKLVKLDENKMPHRAALSSFGIGGTNTHAIFEQYESIQEPKTDKDLYIIPLSAKNGERLKVYAQELLSFLNANLHALEAEVQSDLDLNRLAYTLQVGRETMEARLAFVVSNTSELMTKIEEYLHGNEKISGGFIGKMNQSKDQVQLLEREEDFQEIIHKWFQKGLWGKIAEFWVSGFHIDWEILYPDPKPRRISLPTYPFAKESYWVPKSRNQSLMPSLPNKQENFGKRNSLLWRIIPKETIQLDSGIVFETIFTPQHSWVNSYIVQGQAILSTFAYIEMIRTALNEVEGPTVMEIEEIICFQPLVVIDDISIHIELKAINKQQYAFQIQHPGLKPVLYCQGRINAREEVGEEYIDYQALQSTGNLKKNTKELYERYMKLGIDYKGAFCSVQAMWFNETEVLGELILNESQYEDEYGCHPGLLESAIQTRIELSKGLTGIDLVTNMKSVKINSNTPSRVFSYLRRSSGNEYYQLVLVDPNGKVIIQIEQLSIKRLESRVNDLLYLPIWEEQPLVAPINLDKSNTVLIVYSEASSKFEKTIQDYYRKNKIIKTVLQIELGHQTKPVSGKKWLCNIDDLDGFATCLQGFDSIDCLFFITDCRIENQPFDLSALADSQQYNEIQLLRLMKVLLQKIPSGQTMDCYIITQDNFRITDTHVNPYGGGNTGLAYSIAQGDHRFLVRNIDIAAEDLVSPSNREALFKLILAEKPSDRGEVVKLQSGSRYRQAFLKFVPEIHKIEEGLRKEGVYVIVGGSGTVGEVITRHLIQAYQAKVVWIGRKSGTSEAVRKKIESLSEFGEPPRYIQADVTDLEQMKQAAAMIKSQYSTINGGIFSGLVFTFENSLKKTTEKQFRDIFNVKFKGSINFYTVFQDEPLDFMCYFSSAQAFSFSGAANLSAYASGITFSDTFIRFIRERSRFPVGSINWGFWRASEGDTHSGNIAFLEDNEGIEYFEHFVRLLETGALHQAVCLKVSEPTRELMNWKEDEVVSLAEKSSDSMVSSLWDGDFTVKNKIETLIEITSLARLDEWIVKLLYTQLHRLGLFTRTGNQNGIPEEFIAIFIKAGIINKYQRWMEECLRILETNGYVGVDREQIDRVYVHGLENPESVDQEKIWRDWDLVKESYLKDVNWKTQVMLVDTCLRKLPEILRGDTSATDIIFPDSSMVMVEEVYKNNVLADYFNDIVATIAETYVKQRLKADTETKVRIIEVGAGTGGTSVTVFAKLKPYADHIEYCYTDISKAFLLFAEDKYGPDNPYLTYKLWNIEKPLAEQGIEAGAYDMVIATNVLHATSNIRQTVQNAKATLKTNGVLVVNELVQKSTFETLTFGLLDGWWLYQDANLRIPGSPLLNIDTWRKVLLEAGFRGVQFPVETMSQFDQQVIIAESDGIIRQKAKHIFVGKEKEDTGAVLAPSEAKDVNQLMLSQKPSNPASQRSITEMSLMAPVKVSTESLAELVRNMTLNQLAKSLKVPRESIDNDAAFSDYGVDSIIAVSFVKQVNDGLGVTMNSAVIFNYTSVNRLTDYIVKTYGERIQKQMALSTNNSSSQKTINSIDSLFKGDACKADDSYNDSSSKTDDQLIQELKKEFFANEISVDSLIRKVMRG